MDGVLYFFFPLFKVTPSLYLLVSQLYSIIAPHYADHKLLNQQDFKINIS